MIKIIKTRLNNLWRRTRSALFPVLSIAVIAYGFLQADTEKASQAEDEFNYNFALKDLKGRHLDAKELKGKVIFLNMWATWCGPCREEMPSIQALYKNITDSVNFIILSIDRDNQYAKVKKFVKDEEFTFPVFMPSGALTEQLNVPLIPTTFIIDRSGKVVYHFEGMNDYDSRKFRNLLHDLATAKGPQKDSSKSQ